MTAPLNPLLAAVFPPPVMEARSWLAEAVFPPERPLINLSQAAPVDPPPEGLRRALAEAALNDPAAHLYGPVLGDVELREAVSLRWSLVYGGNVEPYDVAITSGCNQAFCAAIASLCAPGDAVLIPVPWYFNHKMWLDMAGVTAIPIPCDGAMLPDLAAARAAITPAVRAIVLVTPNNPTGAEYPAALMEGFFDLARDAGLGLVVDETYRDFHSRDGAPHDLFLRDDWRGTLVHLYSFSKVYHLTGHRVGALVTGASRIAQIEKFLDTVTICPARLGQIGALWGIENLSQWVAAERDEILARRAVLRAEFAAHLPDWRILGAGAYFAYVEPPFDLPSDKLAFRLVQEQGLLTLPGTMFCPRPRPGADWGGGRALRIAFANADAAGLAETARRLAAFQP